MELFIFARFHAREGEEAAVAAALHDVTDPSRAESGCRAIAAYRSVQDPRLFWIHSRWINEAVFDVHANSRIPGVSWNAYSSWSIIRWKHRGTFRFKAPAMLHPFA
jgi:quinol monooxygenase YgiN